MKEAIWMNKKTGNLRVGWWNYYWPSDLYTMQIKGCPKQSFRDDSNDPFSYGNWIYIGDL